MATVIFYEKPGCINNTKQKKLLQAAGHDLEVHNLLTQAWTLEELRAFLGDRPVADWFNRTAPMVKSGEIIPENLDADAALALMVENPILIRRPLIQVAEERRFGFDTEAIAAWIGLTPLHPDTATADWQHQDLQNCPRTTGAAPAGSCHESD